MSKAPVSDAFTMSAGLTSDGAPATWVITPEMKAVSISIPYEGVCIVLDFSELLPIFEALRVLPEFPQPPSARPSPAPIHLGPPPALAIRNLSVLAYANGFTLWHYKAHGKDLRTVLAPGYFNDASDMMALGDRIMVTCRNGAVDRVVSGVSPSSVTLAALVP